MLIRLLGPAWVLALALLAGAAAGAHASPDPRNRPGIPVEDQIDLVQIDNRILAIDAGNQRNREIDLEIDERLLALESQGLVAVASTTARLLGITSGVNNFQELRLRVNERRQEPANVYLGDRVALVQFPHRLAAMSTTSQAWQTIALGPQEEVGPVYTNTNLVVALTQRRAIAFSPKLADFVEINLTPQETIESVSVRESSVTLATSRRILIFRAGVARFFERFRKNK